MDELKSILLKLLPEGSEITKVYKDGDQIMADVTMPGMGAMSCAVKKNHAGELYLD